MPAPKTTGAWQLQDATVKAEAEAAKAIAKTEGQSLDVESSWTVMRRTLGTHVPATLQHANAISRRLATGRR